MMEGEKKADEGWRKANPNRPVPGSFYDCPISHYLPALLWLGVNSDKGHIKEQQVLCMVIRVLKFSANCFEPAAKDFASFHKFTLAFSAPQQPRGETRR